MKQAEFRAADRTGARPGVAAMAAALPKAGPWSLLNRSPSAPRLPLCLFEGGFCHWPSRVASSARTHWDTSSQVWDQGLLTLIRGLVGGVPPPFPAPGRPPRHQAGRVSRVFSISYCPLSPVQGLQDPRSVGQVPGDGGGASRVQSGLRSLSAPAFVGGAAINQAFWRCTQQNYFDCLSTVLALCI